MLKDSHERDHDYLRISVTDKCNLRCVYCIPAEGVKLLQHDEVLRNEEFIRLIDIFIGMGIKKIRFTGGEPFIRKGLMDIISLTRKKHPGIELCLTTNGVMLGGFIEQLYEFGVRKINVSLDTLSREAYSQLTGFDSFDTVTANIDKLLEFNYFDLKINSVLFKNTINELDHFLEYFSQRDLTLRFIEMMPFTSVISPADFLSAEGLINELSKKGDLSRKTDMDTSVALMYNFIYKGAGMRLGIIPPVTHKFCSSCSRLRITSDGSLKTCLYSGKDYDLKTVLREGGSDISVTTEIRRAIAAKKAGHDIECWFEGRGCSSVQEGRRMSRIGG